MIPESEDQIDTIGQSSIPHHGIVALEYYNEAKLEFRASQEFRSHSVRSFQLNRPIEEDIDTNHSTWQLYWHGSDELTEVPISKICSHWAEGAQLNHFRESFYDPAGLSAGCRIILLSCLSKFPKEVPSIHVFAEDTPLAHAFRDLGVTLFTSPLPTLDQTYGFSLKIATNLHPDESLDFVVFCDVFHYLGDYKSYLIEALRTLQSGGYLIFSVPFFPFGKTLTRAEVDDQGEITHHLPEEMHGDRLCYRNFAWSLIDELKEVGFQDAFVEVCHEPKLGLFSDNSPVAPPMDPNSQEVCNMLPLVIVARKG